MKERILASSPSENQIALFYTGQMGYILKYRGLFLMIDGYLTDSVDKGSTERVKWERKYPSPLSPSSLDFVDYVFCSHNHNDHADPETLSALAESNKKAVIFAPSAALDTILSAGIPRERVVPLVTDREYPLAEGLSFRAIPSAHEELHPDGNGGYDEVGFLFSFGGIPLYHAGDCCPYPGLTERISGCDVCILPINGRDAYRTQVLNIIGNFTIPEAVSLAKDAGAKLLIPGHYDLYEINGEDPARFTECLHRENPSQAFALLSPGEELLYP